jgi:hypothetical protein
MTECHTVCVVNTAKSHAHVPISWILQSRPYTIHIMLFSSVQFCIVPFTGFTVAVEDVNMWTQTFAVGLVVAIDKWE